MLRNIYDVMVQFQADSNKNDYQFLSPENMNLLRDICKAYDEADYYLTPDEKKLLADASDVRKKGIADKSFEEISALLKNFVEPALALTKSKKAYRDLKASLDNKFFQTNQENKNLKSIENIWRDRSQFCNLSADTLINMFSFIDQIEKYLVLMTADMLNKDVNLQAAKKGIEEKLKQEREALSQAFLERLKLLAAPVLQQIKDNTISPDEMLRDDVCFDTLALMQRDNFLTLDQFKAFERLVPPRSTLNAVIVKNANACICKHGSPSQIKSLEQIFNGRVPLPQEGHLQTYLHLDDSLNFSVVLLGNSTRSARSFDHVNPVNEELLQSINLSSALKDADYDLETLAGKMRQFTEIAQKDESLPKDKMAELIALLNTEHKRIAKDIDTYRFFTSTQRTLNKLKAITDAKNSLLNKTDKDLRASLETLLSTEDITQSRGYFKDSTLASKLQDFYKKHLPDAYKQWNDRKPCGPIDTTLYLRY